MAKRNLTMGISDYPGVHQDLSGCVNDAHNWNVALTARGFDDRLLTDAQVTRKAMVDSLLKLGELSQPGDWAVVTYSGHGSWAPDDAVGGDEADGRDEALVPYDIDATGELLLDDDLYAIFKTYKQGVKLVMISDSCHSGSVARFVRPLHDPLMPIQLSQVRFLPPAAHIPANQIYRAHRVAHKRASCKGRQSALLLSGCSDHEYSYDTWIDGKACGALSYFALKALEALPTRATFAQPSGATFSQWFTEIRKSLPSVAYPQTPLLSGSREQKAWPLFV